MESLTLLALVNEPTESEILSDLPDYGDEYSESEIYNRVNENPESFDTVTAAWGIDDG